MDKTVNRGWHHFRISRWYALGIVFAGIILTTLSATDRASADVSFEQLELALDLPIDTWISRDIDGDGDTDLVLLRTSNGASTSSHEAVIVRQQPTGSYSDSERQVLSLQSTSGLYDVGDVVGDTSLELIQVTRSGVRYFTQSNGRFDTTAHPLVTPDLLPDIPSRANPQAWDFAWPLVSGEKECVALPYIDRLDLWRPTSPGGGAFTLTGSISCDAISRHPMEPWSSGYRMLYPELKAQSTPAALEFFFRSGANWRGARRSSVDSTEFVTSLDFAASPGQVGQVLGIRPEFHSGCLMRDLNDDGAPDVVFWTNEGGINTASCHVSVYFGPFNSQLPATPHDEVSIEGVYGFPSFGDLTGDGRLDMLVCAMETGSLSTAKMFVMKKLSLHLLAYHQRNDNSFSPVADYRGKTDYRLDLNNPEPVIGPIVVFAGDLDNDGFDDFVVQTGQDRLEVFRGHQSDLIDEDSPQRWECRQAIKIESVDVDGDGRRDLLLQHSGGESMTALLAR